MRDLVVNMFIQLSNSMMAIVGMIAIMLLMGWRLTLVALAVVPALVLASGKFSRELQGATRKQRRRERKIARAANASELRSLERIIQDLRSSSWSTAITTVDAYGAVALLRRALKLQERRASVATPLDILSAAEHRASTGAAASPLSGACGRGGRNRSLTDGRKTAEA